MIVIANFVIGVFTPITLGPEDDVSFFDPMWRFVQGFHLRTDFHDPLGFGPFSRDGYAMAPAWTAPLRPARVVPIFLHSSLIFAAA